MVLPAAAVTPGSPSQRLTKAEMPLMPSGLLRASR